MTRSLTIPAALLFGVLQAVAVSAGDLSQLAAGAGVTEAEAAGMTLGELHALKINRESRADDRVTVSSREYPVFEVAAQGQLVSTAGLDPAEARGLGLTEIAAMKASLNSGHDDQVPIAPAPSGRFDPAANPQLVAAAGLTVAEAEGMSLAEIVRHKINREARGDDRQHAAR